MKRIAAMILLAALVLAGCGGGGPTSGYVQKKDHDEGYYYTQMICAGYGKYGCTVWVPIQQHQPESWRLLLREGQSGPQGWRGVTPEEYGRYDVGDLYEGVS